MPDELRAIVHRLLTEIRKDLPFFGVCGVAVGLFMLWHFRLGEMGLASGKSWPMELFADFVSFSAYTLIFIGLIAVSSFATVLRELGRPNARLEATVIHLEERLSQIASSIISFTLGLSALALLHALLTLDGGGFALALMVLLFDWIVFCGFATSLAISRRIEPFNKVGFAIVAMVGSVFFVWWLLVKGVGQ